MCIYDTYTMCLHTHMHMRLSKHTCVSNHRCRGMTLHQLHEVLGFMGHQVGKIFVRRGRDVWDAWIYTFCTEMMLRGICIDIWVCYGELGAFVLKTIFWMRWGIFFCWEAFAWHEAHRGSPDYGYRIPEELLGLQLQVGHLPMYFGSISPGRFGISDLVTEEVQLVPCELLDHQSCHERWVRSGGWKINLWSKSRGAKIWKSARRNSKPCEDLKIHRTTAISKSCQQVAAWSTFSPPKKIR